MGMMDLEFYEPLWHIVTLKTSTDFAQPEFPALFRFDVLKFIYLFWMAGQLYLGGWGWEPGTLGKDNSLMCLDYPLVN